MLFYTYLGNLFLLSRALTSGCVYIYLVLEMPAVGYPAPTAGQRGLRGISAALPQPPAHGAAGNHPPLPAPAPPGHRKDFCSTEEQWSFSSLSAQPCYKLYL